VDTFKQDVLKPLRDALVTTSLWALHQYFMEMPKKEGSGEPSTLRAFPVPKVVQDFTDDHKARQVPFLAFLKKHIGVCVAGVRYKPLPLAFAFTQYLAFARNENSVSMTRLSKGTFQLELQKQQIEVKETNDSKKVKVLDGRYLKEEVEDEKVTGDNSRDGWRPAPPPSCLQQPDVQWFPEEDNRKRKHQVATKKKKIFLFGSSRLLPPRDPIIIIVCVCR